MKASTSITALNLKVINKTGFSSLFLLLCGMLMVSVCTISLAQVIVVEAGDGVAPGQQQRPVELQPAPQARNTAPPSGNSSEIVVSLYMQLEALQQEVQALRGLVEEQNYQMRRMQTEQRDRYLNVDSRLTELQLQIDSKEMTSTSVPIPAVQQTNDISTAATTETDSPLVNRPRPIEVNPQESGPGIMLPAIVSAPDSAGITPPDQRELYRQALSQLLDENNYPESIALFRQYLEVFPDGRYVTNSLYWQGEALILAEQYQGAIEIFGRIINEYPDDPKAPGALLKAGVAYNQLGDAVRAMDYWESISEKYPDSTTEIRAAEDYMQRARQN